MAGMRSYDVVARYLQPGIGWQERHTPVHGTYQAVGRTASREAQVLDDQYGGDHFWTVDVYAVADDGQHTPDGSYYQLFHGRLS